MIRPPIDKIRDRLVAKQYNAEPNWTVERKAWRFRISSISIFLKSTEAFTS